MFRNDDQISSVCRALLRRVGRDDLWQDGPTEEAMVIYAAGGSPLSAGERVLLLLSWSLWNQDETLRFYELARLDRGNQRAVAELLVALSCGYEAVDAWVVGQYERSGEP